MNGKKRTFILIGTITLSVSILIAIICFISMITTTAKYIAEYFGSIQNFNQASSLFTLMVDDMSSDGGFVASIVFLFITPIMGIIGIVFLVCGALVKTDGSKAKKEKANSEVEILTPIENKNDSNSSVVMSFCPKCGYKLGKEDSYCPKCGYKVK